MEGIKLISSQELFQKEFARCCHEYDNLEIFTAWVGNPGNQSPFYHLDKLKTVTFFLGISFDHSHPDGIEYLINKKFKVAIVEHKSTYHPKLYFFNSKGSRALLMGSSNFTYSGFNDNYEANLLLEGTEQEEKIYNYQKEINIQIKGLRTFIPDNDWLNIYRKKYKARQEKLKQLKLNEESLEEDKLIYSASWLGKADWDTYIIHIRKGLMMHQTKFAEPYELKAAMLKEYQTNLKTPWSLSLFDTIENRRRILGKKPYGWLGHIGASGKVQKLLTNSTIKEKRIIVNTINRIAIMQKPINFLTLKKELIKLEQLGPTIKVWGRMLAITRPDIFCTISSPNVRKSLSILLDKPKSYFETIDGYLELLKLIHQSPWFNSLKPKDNMEQQIWEYRVAFLDVVFY